MRSTWQCLSLALVLPLTLSPLAAQEAPPDPVAQSFTDTTAVRLVNVEVSVTDKKGRPVPGLTAADFQLFEDGRPVGLIRVHDCLRAGVR